MTFSIAARCEATGMFGLAVSSSSPAVAARCAFARAGVGAVSTQNITDPSLGPQLLDLMALGASAQQAIEIVCNTSDGIEYRQITAVDSNGDSAGYSGSQSLGIHAHSSDKNVVCAGNLLCNDQIPEKMVSTFMNDTQASLADRLLNAMQAALIAGGEMGPVHSAGLILVDKVSWPVASLRIDWHEAASPISELVALWKLYEPQLEDYVTRAKDPASAPKYGVPGDA